MASKSEPPLFLKYTGEFASADREKLFRKNTEKERFARLRFVWAIASIFFIAFGLYDILLVEHYYRLLWLRFGIFSIGMLIIGLTYTRLSVIILDLSLFIALALISILYALITYLRVDVTPYHPGSAIVLSMGIYLFSPNRFLMTCANGLFCSLIIAVASQGKNASLLIDYIRDNIYLIPANILAASSLLQLNIIRRSHYNQQEQLLKEVTLRRKVQRQLSHENKRSQQLLLDLLPGHIVERLGKNRKKNAIIADYYPNVTVLYADIAEFSKLSAAMPVQNLVVLLDTIHRCFDRLAQIHGMEKIRANGNSYTLIAGASKVKEKHAEKAAEMAISMTYEIGKMAERYEVPLKLHTGMHSGSIAAGVIGRRKLCYDIWGEAVNTACILALKSNRSGTHISNTSYQLLRCKFAFGDPITIDIGENETKECRVLKGRKDSVALENLQKF